LECLHIFRVMVNAEQIQLRSEKGIKKSHRRGKKLASRRIYGDSDIHRAIDESCGRIGNGTVATAKEL
jgi:hypothetical protein